MVVATCVIHLELPGVRSLKEKRRIVKSILAKVRRQFNVAAAEIDHHDVWQSSAIALVTIGTDTGHLHRVLEHAVAWLADARPDIPIAAYSITAR